MLMPSFSTLESWLKRHGSALISLAMVGICLFSVATRGLNPAGWDLMLLSGVATFVIGLRLSQEIPSRLVTALKRLADREVLQTDFPTLERFEISLEKQAGLWAHRGGLTGAAAILAAFLACCRLTKPGLMVVETLGGYVAGRYLGRMACYGALSRLLRRWPLTLQLQPGHPDKVAGLKPLGDFYFAQAMVAAIPAVYLAVWWLAIPLLPQYQRWREPYLGLLAIAVVFEVLAFAVPLWLFHREMQTQKQLLLQAADRLSHRITVVQEQLVASQSPEEREELKDYLTDLTQRYWHIENLPTWPVNTKIISRFTLNNVALVLPLLGNVVGSGSLWEGLGIVLEGLLNT